MACRLILQWGKVWIPKDTYETDRTFPVSFTTTDIEIFGNVLLHKTGGFYQTQPYELSPSSYKMQINPSISTNDGCHFCWFAIGK